MIRQARRGIKRKLMAVFDGELRRRWAREWRDDGELRRRWAREWRNSYGIESAIITGICAPVQLIFGPVNRAQALDIGRGVDAGRRRLHRLHAGDARAVPQRAQLLQALAPLQRACAARRKPPQIAAAVGVDADVAARRGGAAGMRGSSPCKLTMMSSAPSCSCDAASSMRSLPDGCVAAVMTARAPAAAAASAMRASSVATVTEAAALRRAQSTTRAIIVLPPKSSSGLPGRRVAA